jgi:sterol desaturase/sphingolipid hydroxylase (fatty acid hydroxylase superfamily)
VQLFTILSPVGIALCFGGGRWLERRFPARPLPEVRGWTLRAGLMLASTLGVGALLPVLIAEQLAGHSLWRLDGLGTWGGAALGLLVNELFLYWLHRLQHMNHALWRFTHQMHHAAERVDVLGAGFFHPLDIAVGAVLSSVVAALVGLPESSVAIVGLFTLFLGVMQHVNVRTPVWLGYIVQRPEAHAIHHRRGHHRDNYGNIVLWDMVFGTFKNPKDFEGPAGFYENASAEVGALLVGRDLLAARIDHPQ